MTDLNVIIAPEPFTPRVERMTMPALGQPVKVMLAGAIAQGKLDADDIKRVRVFINGVVLPDQTPDERREVMRYVPEGGDLINVVVSPLGGGGSGSGENKALQTVLTIAVIAVSFIPGIGPIAAAAIRIGGMLAISKIFAPKAPQQLASGNNRQALQRATNNYRPRDPMAMVLGLQRWGFDLAAPPYTQLIGEDSWLNIAFLLHYGPCWVGNEKIGETLLADYPAEDYQVEYFLTPGVPRRSYLYPDRVVQENFQDELTKGGAFEVHTTATSTERVGVDVTLPNGLRYNKDNGKILPQEVQGLIEYGVAGSGVWTPAPVPAAFDRLGHALPAGSFYIQARTQDALRRSFDFNTATKGQFDVRVRVWDPDNDDPTIVTDKTYWTSLRSIERKDPIADQVVSVMFLRIRSTDDLNGNLPVVTGDVEPIVPVFSGGAWTGDPTTYSAAWQRSSNAVALLRYVLTGYPAANPLTADEFHSSAGLTFNLIEANPTWKGGLLVTEKKTQQDLMVSLGKMGRFSTYWNGNRLCFVPDWFRDAPRQAFTGANANNYRYRRIFPETIHAAFVEFSNTDENSAPDELWVYADGYDATNATLFESVKIEFACTAERAFQEGRVYLAKRLLQVELHEWNAGPDAIGTTYGDRVLVSHEAALLGLERTRCQYRHMTGALVAGVRLAAWVEMEVGKTYAIDLRRADEMIRGIAVQTVAGRTRDLLFAAPRAADISPRKGDLVIFGETGLISEDVEIIDVEPQSDLTVTFRALPYMADAIAGAINDPIPTIISTVRPREPAPRPQLVVPDSATPSGVIVSATVSAWKGTPIAGFAGRWRQVYIDAIEGTVIGAWVPMETQPFGAGIVKTGAISGAAHAPASGQAVTVDLEVWTLLVNGDTSEKRTVSDIPILADVAAPTGVTANGVTRTGADGSSKGAIAITANPVVAGDVRDLEIEVQAHTGGAWSSAIGSPFSARNPVGDITGLGGGTVYDVRVRWLTYDNWPSAWNTKLNVTVPAGSDVSSDTKNVGTVPVATLLASLDHAVDTADEAKDLADAATDALFDPASGAIARLDQLSAKGTPALNPNGSFVDWVGTLPDHLSVWDGVPVRSTSTSLRGNVIDIPGGAGANAGVIWTSTNMPPYSPADVWYTLEADFELVAGSLNGSGLLFAVLDAGQTTFLASRAESFATPYGVGTVGRAYRFKSAPFKIDPAAGMTWLQLYAMTHWSSHAGGIATANRIKWGRVEVFVASDVEASYTDDIAVLTAADASAVGRITTLETRQTVRPNKVKNSDGSDPVALNYWNVSGAAIWGVGEDGQVGNLIYSTGGALSYLYQDIPGITPGAQFTFSIEGNPGANFGAARPIFYADWLNAAGGLIIQAGTYTLDNSTLGWGTRQGFTTTAAPAGAATLRVTLYSPASAAIWSFSRVMVAYGTVRVPWNDVKTETNTLARVRQGEIAQSSTDGAVAGLTASVGTSLQQGDSLTNNPRFGRYTTSPGIPEGWNDWVSGALGTRQPGQGANNAYRSSVATGGAQGISQQVFLTEGPNVLTGEANCDAGNWGGSGMQIIEVSGGGYIGTLNFATDPDTTGNVGVGGTWTRRFTKIVTVPPGHGGAYTLYLFTGYTGLGSVVAKTLTWYRCAVDPLDAGGKKAIDADANATTALSAYSTLNAAFAAYQVTVAATYATSTSVASADAMTLSTANAHADGAVATLSSSVTATYGGLPATVSAQGAVISGLTGRTASYLTKVAAAGADPAYIFMQSDTTTPGGADSFLSLVAKSLLLYNISSGTLLKVMEAIAGLAHFMRPIYIEAPPNRVIIGPAFGVSSNLLLWYGDNGYDDASATPANAIFALTTAGGTGGVVAPVLTPPQDVVGFGGESFTTSSPSRLLASVAVTVPAGANNLVFTPAGAAPEWDSGGTSITLTIGLVWWDGATETAITSATMSALSSGDVITSSWDALGSAVYTIPSGAGELRLYGSRGGPGNGTFSASTRFTFYGG